MHHSLRLPSRTGVNRLTLASAVFVIAALIAGCGQINSAATPSSAAPTELTTSTNAGGCQLKPTRDLIVRSVSPGVPTSAQVLGDVDLLHCRSSVDLLRDTAPTGDGYCTEAAWASDNPGYNADATPARHLKKLVLAVGPAC